MFEEMTFSDKLQRKLMLESFGIGKPSVNISVILGEKNFDYKDRQLHDCCFRFYQLKKENKITEATRELIKKLEKRIKDKIEFLTRDLRELEGRFTDKEEYKENLSEFRGKYNEILSWRAALEGLSDKPVKPFNGRVSIKNRIDDAKRWNDFLKEVGKKI